METNFGVIGLVVLLVLALVIYIVIRNKKDRRHFEKDLNDSEVPPEKHEDERERL
jgi:flagellar biosynthesis/type III secretory pathway M-ring protein FliF/YscJ